MKVRVKSIRLNRQSVRRAMRESMPQLTQAVGEKVGQKVIEQIGKRFKDGSDDDIKWAPLWADNDGAVAAVLQSGSSRRGRKKQEQARNNAARSIERADREYDEGKITRSQRNRRIRNNETKLKGLPQRTRAGGHPLQDNGLLRSSFTSDVRAEQGRSIVTVGSPLPYARYHQNGFSTSGPSYIPLTNAARRGWNPKLIPGWDYVVLQGVTVPARPMVRLTQRNRDEIVETITEAFRNG